MEEKTLAIVLFEDNEEEIKKVRALVDETRDIIMLAPVMRDLSDASLFFGKLLHSSHFSSVSNFAESHLEIIRKESVAIATHRITLGILTDLNMPLNPGQKEDAVGVAIAMAAKTAGLPVVVCSSGGQHHVHWAESILHLSKIPVNYTKNWENAISLLKKEAGVI